MKITFTNNKPPAQPGLVYQDPVAVPEHVSEAWRVIRDVKPATPALIPAVLRPVDTITYEIEGWQSDGKAWQSPETVDDKQGNEACRGIVLQTMGADKTGE